MVRRRGTPASASPSGSRGSARRVVCGIPPAWPDLGLSQHHQAARALRVGCADGLRPPLLPGATVIEKAPGHTGGTPHTTNPSHALQTGTTARPPAASGALPQHPALAGRQATQRGKGGSRPFRGLPQPQGMRTAARGGQRGQPTGGQQARTARSVARGGQCGQLRDVDSTVSPAAMTAWTAVADSRSTATWTRTASTDSGQVEQRGQLGGDDSVNSGGQLREVDSTVGRPADNRRGQRGQRDQKEPIRASKSGELLIING